MSFLQQAFCCMVYLLDGIYVPCFPFPGLCVVCLNVLTGVQHLQLRLCKNKRSPIDIAACRLDPIVVKPSSVVVSSIEAEGHMEITAGSILPLLL